MLGLKQAVVCLFVALALSACSSFDAESFTKHMEARNCATEGRIDLHPVAMPGSKVTGHVAWNCGKGDQSPVAQ